MSECDACLSRVAVIDQAAKSGRRDAILFVFGEPEIVLRRSIGDTLKSIRYVSQENSGGLGVLWTRMSGVEAARINASGVIEEVWRPTESFAAFLGVSRS